MSKLVASAGSKEALANCINEFYFSENYIITEDNKVYNTKTKKFLDKVIVRVLRKRWRFEFV